jgi:hypothetical protein
MNSKVITRGLVRYKISPNQYPGDRALQAQRFFCRYVVGWVTASHGRLPEHCPVSGRREADPL